MGPELTGLMKPLLKWAGGKSKLVHRIAELFPSGVCSGTYYEPFLGSGSVFLHLRAWGKVERAVIGDINPKLVAFHIAIRDEVENVLDAMDNLPVTNKDYYSVRDQFNTGEHVGAEHAALFVWLNRAGFNGLYRENRDGHNNVPVGNYDVVRLPGHDHVRRVSELLQGVDIRVSHFGPVIDEAGKNDLVYCDPPYIPLSETAMFTDYCSSPFGVDENLSLAKSAWCAARRGAAVVLSNHDTDAVRQHLYPESEGFRHESVQVSRTIGQSGRGRVAEILARIGPGAPDIEVSAEDDHDGDWSVEDPDSFDYSLWDEV